jgi:hypothetical protein
MPQPTDVSCGPTCLHAVYGYYGDFVDLDFVIESVRQLKDGGTLAVMLGNHALRRGYRATIYTYNLHVFDPSWFDGEVDLRFKLEEQSINKVSRKLKQATRAYLDFLSLGGEIKYQVLTARLLSSLLERGIPILTGLSATYLYGTKREIGETNTYDDIKGEPAGHFVVISEMDAESSKVTIADPLAANTIQPNKHYYQVDIERVINAILLGIVTYDANLLIIEPKNS